MQKQTGHLLSSLVVAFTSFAPSAHARVTPDIAKLMSQAKCQANLGAEDLLEPELESKLRVENKVTLKTMTDELNGLTFQIQGPSIDRGNRVLETYTYKSTYTYPFLYIDRNYDVLDKNSHLLGFEKRSMLRVRERYDWDEKKGRWYFKKIGLHAKNESVTRGRNFTARNEVRGFFTKDKKAFYKILPQILNGEIEDRAVAYFRSIIGNDGDLIYVMKTKQKRKFFHVESALRTPELSAFTITLDKIQYKAMIGEPIRGKDLGAEVELYNPDKKVTPGRMLLLENVTDYLAQRYGLTFVNESKYVTGANMTIFLRDSQDDDSDRTDPGEPNLDQDDGD